MIHRADSLIGKGANRTLIATPLPRFAAPLRGGPEGVPFQSAAGVPFHVAVANVRDQPHDWPVFR